MLTVPVGKTKFTIQRDVKNQENNEQLRKGDKGYVDDYFDGYFTFVRLSDGVVFNVKNEDAVSIKTVE